MALAEPLTISEEQELLRDTVREFAQSELLPQAVEIDREARFPKVKELLDAAGAENVLLTGGGIISGDDMSKLEAVGVGQLFGPGARLADLVEYIEGEVARRRTTSRSA